MSDVKLYNYWRSSASWRVRIGLNLKHIAYDYLPVNIVDGQQFAEAYGLLNPGRAVPTLHIDGLALAESMAILEYLDETRPAPPLLPKSAADRAQARRIAEQVNSGIQPYQNLHLLKRLRTEFGADDAKVKAWAGHYNHVGLEKLEGLLTMSAGRCCVGDEVTIADVCLVPQIYSARRYGADPSAFPLVSKVEKYLASLPAFDAARPELQPDAPKS